MQVGIINFSFINMNYGAVLNGYAISSFLMENDYKVKTLDIRPRFAENFLYTDVSNFLEFKKKRLPSTGIIQSWNEYRELNNQFDAFIVGSDQVFNWEKIHPDYMKFALGFVDNEKLKIAYAASLGKNKIIADNFHINILRFLFSQFDAISLREKSGVQYFENYLNISAQLVCDPTFLLTPEQWIRLADANEQKIQNHKIFYILNDDTRMKFWSQIKEYQNIFNMSLELWIKSIKDSEFVITDSFHGTCFCIMFNKRFCVVINKFHDIERLINLFELFDIPKQLLVIYDPHSNDLPQIIYDITPDYNKINEKINKSRKYSQDWILNSLKKNPENINKINNNAFQAFTEVFYKLDQLMLENNYLRSQCANLKKIQEKYQELTSSFISSYE